MKVELTNYGTWICTGRLDDHRFVVEADTKEKARKEGYAAFDAIMERIIGEMV
mgnify:CR=1 FL=1